MNKIKIPLCEFTILKKTIPYAYGTSVCEVLPRRAWSLLSGNIPNQKSIKNRNTLWVNANKKKILQAKNTGKTDKLIVNLPFQSIFLHEAIKEGYITINNDNKITITISKYRNIKRWNFNFLQSDLLRELLLTTTVGSAKQLFELIDIQDIPYECAVILGLVKGLSKTLSDNLIYKKEIIGSNMLLKCSIDVLAEVATVFLIRHLDQKPEAFFKAFIKGILKYLLKHFCQLTFMLISCAEIFLETSKAGFKGFLRDYFYSMIGAFIGPMIGSLIGAIATNIFFDQCTYSPTQHREYKRTSTLK